MTDGLLQEAVTLLLPGRDPETYERVRDEIPTAEWKRRRNELLRKAGHPELADRLDRRDAELEEARRST